MKGRFSSVPDFSRIVSAANCLWCLFRNLLSTHKHQCESFFSKSETRERESPRGCYLALGSFALSHGRQAQGAAARGEGLCSVRGTERQDTVYALISAVNTEVVPCLLLLSMS